MKSESTRAEILFHSQVLNFISFLIPKKFLTVEQLKVCYWIKDKLANAMKNISIKY